MRVLRLRHSLTAGGGGLIAVDYDAGHGASGFTSDVPFLCDLNERDRSRLRFYLENFLTCPNPAALEPVGVLQTDLHHWGEELFRQVFLTDREAHWYYEQAVRDLHTLRIEILSDHPHAWTVPWEILFDPGLGWLAPQVGSFVRLSGTLQPSAAPPPLDGPLRVLYVVGRPAGSQEIPFHSVARPLLEACAGLEDRMRIDFLRPPTFERLAKVLGESAEAGRPYHVLHFDGHGVFTDSPQDFAGEVDPRFEQKGGRLARRSWTRRRGGARGYLLFEDLEGGEVRRLVDGVQIGNLVAHTGTPLIVLHACQSATARTETLERLAADPTGPGRCPASPAGEAPDEHDQDLAYQSLAAEIVRYHPREVLALPWTLPPVTATRILAEIYARIAGGSPLGEAAGALRLDLLHGLRHDSLLGPVEVDDWLVPLVYESEPRPVCAPRETSEETGRTRRAMLDELPPELPAAPPWGFVDRPEIFFTLDRAFDVHAAVLLHGSAGSGKSAMARELALFYRQSGGLEDLGNLDGQPGAVLWSSFESPNPLALFDALEAAFPGRLSKGDRETRQAIALELLAEVPTFWVWDNLELVSGMPDASAPPWPEEERRFLTGFLRGLGRTRCKVLLVSRQPEGWLESDPPCRIALPPMPMEERGELTIRVAAQHGLAVREVVSFAPLLKISEGNPLKLTFLLDEALRQGRRTAEREETTELSAAFLAFLRSGYKRVFGEEDRRRLALLHLFHGHVDLNVLCWMGHPEAPWCLPPIRGLGRERWAALLDRAAQESLLTSRGGDHYGIDPALAFFFRGLFERYWQSTELSAARAFAESTAGLGSYYHQEHRAGNRNAMAGLLTQEANLLAARSLARRHGWHNVLTHAMLGLETLYTHTGRHEEWKRLLEEANPEQAEPETLSKKPRNERIGQPDRLASRKKG